MTASSFIRQADLQRIFKAAKASGSTVQIDLATRVVTVLPFAPREVDVMPKVSSQANVEWESDEEIISRLDFAAKPKGGVVIPDPGSALQKWYDQLGFDPKTMNHDDYKRLLNENEIRWRNEVPGAPLTKLEKSVLSQLLAHKKGVEVSHRLVKGCGPTTEERLDARGFIEIRRQKKFPDRTSGYVLTEIGRAAAIELKP